MNGIQSDLFKGFTPPEDDPLLTSRFFGHLINSILTVGLDATNRNLRYQTRIYELEKEQALLLKKYAHTHENWKVVEQRLGEMIDEVLAWQSEEGDEGENDGVNELQEKIDQLAAEKEELDLQSIEYIEYNKESSFIRLSRRIIDILNIFDQFFSNFSSLGVYGCYENYFLKKRIKILNSQNDYLVQKHMNLQREHQSFFEKNIELLKHEIECKDDLINISQTEPSKAYFEIRILNQQLQELKEKEDDLKKQLSDQQGESSKEIRDLRNQIGQLEGDQRELRSLRQQMQNRGQSSSDPAFNDLQKRLGPLSPKYQLKQHELDSVNKVKEDKEFTDAFTQRYKGIVMAAELFRRGLAYALKEIFDMVDQGKIKLNRSLGTPTSTGAQVVYRFLALDWIKGGRVVKTCHGYELYLNEENLNLVPSHPENVLKNQTVEGKHQPTIAIHFNRRCDLIPEEEILQHTSAACGIDPIAAKCLWVKLSQDDRKHFLNLLLEPGVEDDDKDYVAAKNYIAQLSSQQQKEIYILRDLISDIATAVEAKFRQRIAMPEWSEYLDVDEWELQPFKKDDPSIITHPMKEDDKDEPLIPWQLDFDILSASTKNGKNEQTDFYALILEAQETHQIYFNNLNSKLLQKPMAKGKIIDDINWSQLKNQFYTSHQLIGNHGCLLSNFLAVAMVDQKELIGENIVKLKAAMAAYLDNVDHAKEFEGALKNDFNCTVGQFRDWLKGKSNRLDGEYLTPTVLAIAAYTLGVHVVLFTPPSGSGERTHTKGQVDEYGRLMPVEDIEGHHFGPPTQEVFFMAVENNYSYYGLFPKMDLKKTSPSEHGIDTNDWDAIEKLNQYWERIETSI